MCSNFFIVFFFSINTMKRLPNEPKSPLHYNMIYMHLFSFKEILCIFSIENWIIKDIIKNRLLVSKLKHYYLLLTLYLLLTIFIYSQSKYFFKGEKEKEKEVNIMIFLQFCCLLYSIISAEVVSIILTRFIVYILRNLLRSRLEFLTYVEKL